MKSIFWSVATSLVLINNTAYANLTVDNGYARATPPHAKNSAAFMVIHNSNKKEVNLVAASSNIAERVELHTHLVEDGMMKMRQVKQISIPAGSQIELQPGGYHIMFLGLKQPLKEDERVPLRLYFDNGEEIALDTPIKNITMHNKIKHTNH